MASNAICSYPCQVDNVNGYLILSNSKTFYEEKVMIMSSGWFYFDYFHMLFDWPASQPRIFLKTSSSALLTSSKTNADGLIDVGQCVGSCINAQSYQVSTDKCQDEYKLYLYKTNN